ncbi:CYFA0S05e04962g1_1 [Cyberlindnera fabianii]|uniref:Ubiquitin thioesterase OTU n=1 Tax=Cyberlindnera fabianii TaxID=36022 RepID=A0A061AZK6_CYBFA|nr:CYFA0S05e04962g1_1 [Cyberlindnera fabianii]
MRLKVVTPEKQEVVVIDDNATIGQLVQQLVDGGTTTTTSIKVRSGFPPKLVDMTEPSASLLDIGIRAGDKLMVEEDKQAEAAPVAASAVPTVNATVPPAATPASKTTASSSPKGNIPHIQMPVGYLVLRRVPDDNSCLFRSISYAVMSNMEEGSQLRSIVADAIRSDTTSTYSAAILGKPVDEYIDWIQKPTSWGGAIELQILSKYLNITIHTLDVETTRVYSFNEGMPRFIYLLYSGIHYDTVAYTPLSDLNSTEGDECAIGIDSEIAFEFADAVQKLGKKLNNSRYVTNTKTFTIKCLVCQNKFKGEKDASKHAQETMHLEFGEVDA